MRFPQMDVKTAKSRDSRIFEAHNRSDRWRGHRDRTSFDLYRKMTGRMINITIRRAEIRDADALPDIEQSAGETFRLIPGLAWLADGDNIPAERHRQLIAQGACWVAVGSDDYPVGFVCAEVLPSTELHIWEFDMRRDLQGNGFGRRLIQYAIDDARSRTLSAITLTTWRDVAWNENFYAKLGFETLPNDKVGPRLNEILLGEIEQGFAGEKRCAMRLSLN